jgi:hypothetical protein
MSFPSWVWVGGALVVAALGGVHWIVLDLLLDGWGARRVPWPARPVAEERREAANPDPASDADAASPTRAA